MSKDSEKMQQTRQCLSLLSRLHHNGQEWVSTREVADRLDTSVYLARLRLLALQSDGRVNSCCGGRGKALLCKLSC